MKLQDWMAHANKDDEAFAAMVKASPHTVGKWRRGTRFPRPDAMRRIVEATGQQVTANDFYPAPEDPPSTKENRNAV